MKYFGTDGIRQKADQFTPDFINSIIAGLADYADTNQKVLIGGDTRESSEWILQDLSQALESLGFEYANVGVLPTPAINYCFYEMGFNFAVDVTASHNPYTDNGIKIFERGLHSGIKLTEPGCDKIEQALEEGKTISLVSPSDRESLHDEALELYKNHLLHYVGDVNFKNLHLGIDCANGATSVVGKTLFEQLGATVELINADSNYGQKINFDCGSTHLESLQTLVKTQKLDFGIAYDGDGDRCILVDHNGNVVDGDEIIAIIAKHLKLDAIAVTVMANQGLLNWATDQNIETTITAVGDSNVAEAMQTKNIQLGGEQSGHIILPNEPTGDGILTSLVIAKIVAETGKTLHDLAHTMTKLPQVIENLTATPEQKNHLKTSEPVQKLLLEYDEKLKTVSGRLLVRPSGTENLIRITLWGNDEVKIAQFANDLKTKLSEIL